MALGADGPGSTVAQLDAAGRRYAIAIRWLTLTPAAAVALVTAGAGPGRTRTVLALAALVGWSLVYSAVLTRGAPRWVTLGDAAVLSCLALASALVVAPSWLDAGRSWLVPFLTFACVAHQYHTPPRTGVPASLAVAVATGVGTALAGRPAGTPPGRMVDALVSAPWLAIVAGLGALLWRELTRAATDADDALAATEAARREHVIAWRLRADEQAVNSALHDTAHATLLMVGLGTAEAIREVLPARATRDLHVLRTLHGPHQEGLADLMPPLRDLIATIPLAVEVSAPATLPVPAVVTATLVAAVEEALLNTLRHAGVDRARVTCRAGRRTGDPGGGPLSVSVVVQDEGVGFDPAAVPGTRRGLSESVHGRMAAIGGRARVRSRPGRGTRVVLRWPA